MKLLNRNNFAVRFAAESKHDRSRRSNLSAILVTEAETVAMDTSILARVSLPKVDASGFPAFDGFTTSDFSPGLISVDEAKEIEGAIPKTKGCMPILEHAAVAGKTVGEKRGLCVAVTDLANHKVFNVTSPIGIFPKWDSDSLWPSGEPKVDITFDARLLKRMIDAAVKFSDGKSGKSHIRLRLTDANSVMRFDMVNDDGQEMNGMVMPLQFGPKTTFKEAAEKPKETEAVNEPVRS